MTQLSDEQEALRASIKKSAIIWGVVLGLIVAGLVYWVLGSQGGMIRQGGAAVAGLLTAGGLYKKFMSSGAKGAKCAKCNAGFSVSRTDKTETLLKSEARESRKELENGDTEISTWVEEVFDVDETYSCAKCADTTHKTYQSTRKRDEKTEVKSVAKKTADAGKSNSRGKSKQSKGNAQRKV